MSKQDGLQGGQGRGEHRTRRDTERITYERARTAGADRDTARRIARKVAHTVHGRD